MDLLCLAHFSHLAVCAMTSLNVLCFPDAMTRMRFEFQVMAGGIGVAVLNYYSWGPSEVKRKRGT